MILNRNIMTRAKDNKLAEKADLTSETILCERVGNPIMPVSACRTRYKQALENREMGLRHLQECIGCPQGQEVSIQATTEEEMGKKGKCECCGRDDMSLPQKVFDKDVCGFCRAALLSAKDSDLGFDDVQEIIMERAVNLKPGINPPADWPWLGVTTGIDVTKSNIQPSLPEQSGEVPEMPAAEAPVVLPGQNENTKEDQDTATLETLNRINVMLNRKEETVNLACVMMRENLKTVSDVRLKERNVIYIDLRDEPELSAWLHSQGRKNRRSNPTDQVLAILDANMATDLLSREII